MKTPNRLLIPTLLLLLTAVLSPLLTACSPSPPKAPFPPSLPQQLLKLEVFSEALEPVEEDLVWMLLGLEDSALAREQLVRASAFRSTGATCEEVTLLSFVDEASAQAAVQILKLYISSQIEINKDYRPAELPKLKQCLLEQRGTDVLLLVANHYDAARELLAS